MNKKIIVEVIGWSRAILLAMFLSIIVSAFIVQPFTVSGSSMEPTFQGKDEHDKTKVGDKVFIYKTAYLLGKKPKFNEIVIVDSRIDQKRKIFNNLLENPIVDIISGKKEHHNKLWIKRVIGEEHDVLEYKDGVLFRNGEELDEEYINENMITPFGPVVVPDDHVFVMGDNRNNSLDSRNVGAIPVENVVGKVFFRFYPFNSFTSF